MSYAELSLSAEVSSDRLDQVTEGEWIVANGLGGYSSSTTAGLNTRKYHGLLVAAMAPPVRRMVLLSRVEETVIAGGWPNGLANSEYPGKVHPEGYRLLRRYHRWPHPTWTYQGEGWTLQKELFLLAQQNTVCLRYALLAATDEIALELRPLLALRPIHELTYQRNADLEAQERPGRNLRIPPTGRTPEVFLASDGIFCPDSHWYLSTIYRQEELRGYAGLEDLWDPGVVRWRLRAGQMACFVASADPIDLPAVKAATAPDCTTVVVPPTVKAVAELIERPDPLELLHRAAAQFAVKGTGVLAGYPWDPPRTRDALVAMAGTLLVSRKLADARAMLESLLAHERDGLLPSQFAEDGSGPVYQAADISLWFIHAVGQYVRYGGDEQFVAERLLDRLLRIIGCYRKGTSLGIRMDEDGLLSADAGTSWMDSRAGDGPVTGRAGRPVELNAMWYNAMGVVAELAGRAGRTRVAVELSALAGTLKAAFNKRFWDAMRQCCFDVVGDAAGDAVGESERESAVRPNQILAVSLPYSVLDIGRHAMVLQQVQEELLTPMGLRTLAKSDAQYRGRYRGNAGERDRARHQGSVFPWLVGAFTDAYVRVHGRSSVVRKVAAGMLDGVLKYLEEQDTICELFDGDAPHSAGGSVASAAAVGEVLRAYNANVLDREPTPRPVADVRLWPDRPAASRRDSAHGVP